MYEGICLGPNPNIWRVLLVEKANEHDYKQTRLHLTCGLFLFSFKARGGFKETRGKVDSRGLRIQTLSKMQWPGLKFETIILCFDSTSLKNMQKWREIGEHRPWGRHKEENSHLLPHSMCVVLAPNSCKEKCKLGKRCKHGQKMTILTINLASCRSVESEIMKDDYCNLTYFTATGQHDQ